MNYWYVVTPFDPPYREMIVSQDEYEETPHILIWEEQPITSPGKNGMSHYPLFHVEHVADSSGWQKMEGLFIYLPDSLKIEYTALYYDSNPSYPYPPGFYEF